MPATAHQAAVDLRDQIGLREEIGDPSARGDLFAAMPERLCGPRGSGIAAGVLVEFRLRLDQILGRQRRLGQGVELGLAVVERGLERQAHLHAAAILLRLAQRLLQLLGALAVPRQDIGPRLDDLRQLQPAKLVALKQTADEEEIASKIRNILRPFEYTRLDNIIDVIFATAKDVETASQLERAAVATPEAENGGDATSQDRTDTNVINQLRSKIIRAIGEREKTDLIAKSRALYWSADKTVRVSCSISKRYERGTYWYAYHPHWDRFLAESDRAYCVWGCVGEDFAYVLPRSFMTEILNELYITRRDPGKMYWHVELEPGPGDEMQLLVRKSGKKIPISAHTMPI